MTETNLDAPDFAPTVPRYPALAELARVSASALAGTNVYPAFLVQINPATLGKRDRAAVYVTEPNGISLGPGYYDCRLVGTFPTPGHPLYGVVAQRPLYATTCCPSGSSASSGSSQSATPVRLVRIPTGTGINSGSGTIQIRRQITVGADTRLIVPLCAIVTGTPATIISSVTFAGMPLYRDGPLVSFTSGGFIVDVAVYSRNIADETTADLIETVNTGGVGSVGLGMFASLYVDNLVYDSFDQPTQNTGLLSTPDTGTVPPTISTNEICQGCFLLMSPTGSWTWQNNFQSGNQDVSGTLVGTLFQLTEGYRLDAVPPVDAALGGTLTQIAWAGAVRTYA